MAVKTHLSLEYSHPDPLPPGLDNDIRTPPALVERFLSEYTAPGENVIDVFAGYGTTLRVAEAMGRTGYGIEFDADRVAYARERLDQPDNVHHGDVLELDPTRVPTCECCFTSPPFMVQSDDRNPFRNYAGESTYDRYLDDIETAFVRVDSLLAPGGHLVVDVANMKYEDRVTTLAWDVADRLSDLFDFDGEVVIAWESDGNENDRVGNFGYGYDHSYCLVFEKAED